MCNEKFEILCFLSSVSVCERSAVLERFDMANYRVTNAHIDDLIESGCVRLHQSPGTAKDLKKLSITSKGQDTLSSERQTREDQKHKQEREAQDDLYRNQQRFDTVQHEKKQTRLMKLTLLVAFADLFFNHLYPLLKMAVLSLFQ